MNAVERCIAPFIPADKFERQVWQGLVQPLRLAINPRKLESVVDEKRYASRISEIEAQLKNCNSKLRKNSQAREKLWTVFEDDKSQIDKDELALRLNRNKEEKFNLESKLTELEQERDELIRTQESDIELHKFAKNKKGFLRSILKGIMDLSPQDKKTLLEASIGDKISVGLDELHGVEPGVDAWMFKFDPDTRLNFETIKQFVDDGKINKLGQNSQ